MERLVRFSVSVVCLVWMLQDSIAQVTYDKVQPIIEQKCVTCHFEGGYAPFALTTLESVQKRMTSVRYVIEHDIMPPWKADETYRSFANHKALTETEKQSLLDWLKQGCKTETSGKKRSQHTQTALPAPDLVLKMQKPFFVPPVNQNVYICYKIPFELPHDTFVKSIAFIPGNRSIVHHASYQVLAVADDVDVYAGPDYFVYDADTLNNVSDQHDYAYLKLIGKDGQYPVECYHNGWLPGTSMQTYPEGIGFKLPKRGVMLIRNFHFAPTPIPQSDQSQFHIYFAKNPPKRTIGFAAFKPKNPGPHNEWIIKAGDSAFHAHINVKFHNDVSLLNINPHMHRLGRSFIAYAITKQFDTIPLVHIPKWDADWQEFYQFKSMVKVPAGAILHAEATYDNSVGNEENPNSPPKDVLFEWGMNDDSEMMRLVLLYLPYQEGDENVILGVND